MQSSDGHTEDMALVKGWKSITVLRVFSGLLNVVLNKAIGLKSKMFGTRDPYAILRMRSVHGSDAWKSSAKCNSRNPTWDEQTTFLVQVCKPLELAAYMVNWNLTFLIAKLYHTCGVAVCVTSILFYRIWNETYLRFEFFRMTLRRYLACWIDTPVPFHGENTDLGSFLLL